MKKSKLEAEFASQIKLLGLPEPEREYKFHPFRKWRFDFSWEDVKIACEIEGGTWVYGRHNRGDGFKKDCDKYNAAIEYGWKVFRFTREHIEDWTGVNIVKDEITRQKNSGGMAQ